MEKVQPYDRAIENVIGPIVEPKMLHYCRVIGRICVETLELRSKDEESSTGREPSVSHGYLIYALALAFGYRASAASRLGQVVDVLQVMVQLTDDLADLEMDLKSGRYQTNPFREIPNEVLHCLPALFAAGSVRYLYQYFAQPEYDISGAVTQLLRVFSRMALGQGSDSAQSMKIANREIYIQSDAYRQRVEQIAGQQGRLLCLPLWLLNPQGRSGGAFESDASALKDYQERLCAMESWSVAYGRIWELYSEALEHPSAPIHSLLGAAWRDAVRLWPRFPPFEEGMPFSVENLGLPITKLSSAQWLVPHPEGSVQLQ